VPGSIRVSAKMLGMLAALQDRLARPEAGQIKQLPVELPDGSDATKVSQVATIMKTDMLGAAAYCLQAKNLSADLMREAAAIWQTESKKLAPGPDYSTGVMVALHPSPGDAQQIALPDGLYPDDLHCTVLYLGKVGSDVAGTQKELVNIGKKVASQFAPITAKLNGITRFSGEDSDEGGQDPLVVNVDAPEVERLRQVVTQAFLTDRKYEPVSSHGYSPHMTLAYLDPTDDQPINRWQPRQVTFSHLSVVHGSNRVDIPFGQTTEDKSFNPAEPRGRGGRWAAQIERAMEVASKKPQGRSDRYRAAGTPAMTAGQFLEHQREERRKRIAQLGYQEDRRHKDLSSAMSAQTGITADEETELIKKNKQTAKAKGKHAFTPAAWTHPNGHPRCLICGQEQPLGTYCNDSSYSSEGDDLEPSGGADGGISFGSDGWIDGAGGGSADGDDFKDVFGGGPISPSGMPSGQLPIVVAPLSGKPQRRRKLSKDEVQEAVDRAHRGSLT
jgi:2'-5' RNA ligase